MSPQIKQNHYTNNSMLIIASRDYLLTGNGTEGFQSQKVRALAEQLEKAGLNIFYQDERLTTVTAERALIEGGMHRQERRGTVDKVAAAVILQQYLDTLRNQE